VSNAHTSNHQLMRRRTIVAQRRWLVAATSLSLEAMSRSVTAANGPAAAAKSYLVALMKAGLGLTLFPGICKFWMLRRGTNLTRSSKTRIAISDSHAHATLSVSLQVYYAQRLNYTRIAKMAQSSGRKLEELIYCVRAASGNEMLADDTAFIPFLRDLSRLPLDPIVVVLKPRVHLISVSKIWERTTHSSFYAAYMLYLLSSVIILLWYGGKALSAIMRTSSCSQGYRTSHVGYFPSFLDAYQNALAANACMPFNAGHVPLLFPIWVRRDLKPLVPANEPV